MVDPIRRCKPADDGSINVCGTDTERHRLTPELRAIAQEGREAPPKLPRAEAKKALRAADGEASDEGEDEAHEDEDEDDDRDVLDERSA